VWFADAADERGNGTPDLGLRFDRLLGISRQDNPPRVEKKDSGAVSAFISGISESTGRKLNPTQLRPQCPLALGPAMLNPSAAWS
jgi:hypothetical protein